MDEWAASNEETNQIFQLEKIMDKWKRTESRDKENKQKEQMGMTEEEKHRELPPFASEPNILLESHVSFL